MTTDITPTLDAIRARLDAATEGPWQWVDPETDLPCSPDEPCANGDHGEHAYRLSLRTVAEFPTRSVGPLPKFIIHSAEEFQEVEVAPGKWKHPDATFIAQARTDLDVAEKALRAVVEVHVRNVHGWCVECTMSDDDGMTVAPWPCPTIRAITTAFEAGEMAK